MLLEFVEIPEGSFLLGAEIDNSFADESNIPIRRVWLPKYEIARYPASVAEWREYVQQANVNWAFWPELTEACPTDDYPVVYVSWTEAAAYAQWLGSHTGRNVSLPTSAQWEKACRGTNGRDFPWGNDSGLSPDIDFHIVPPYRLSTLHLLESPYGCRHMCQNVYELCSDWFDEFYYTYLDPVAPTGPLVGEEGKRTLRGARLDAASPVCCRRFPVSPEEHSRQIGFRLVINET